MYCFTQWPVRYPQIKFGIVAKLMAYLFHIKTPRRKAIGSAFRERFVKTVFFSYIEQSLRFISLLILKQEDVLLLFLHRKYSPSCIPNTGICSGSCTESVRLPNTAIHPYSLQRKPPGSILDILEYCFMCFLFYKNKLLHMFTPLAL